jgi:hypothetical protein
MAEPFYRAATALRDVREAIVGVALCDAETVRCLGGSDVAIFGCAEAQKETANATVIA